MTQSLTIRSSRTYDVLIGSGLISQAGNLISERLHPSSVVIVSDDNVFPLYGPALYASLEAAGIRVETFVFPHGEASKSLSVYGELLEFMCEKKLTRTDAIAALGGGVAGDLAGFAAATYQRGIGFVQIPASLLADVDSSVGGKTAIDLKGGKNQAGCFYQPMLVICDTDTLATLPEAEYRNGCAEIIKYAMIGSGSLFHSIGALPIREQYGKVIAECIAMKRDIVEKDEYDTGLRMLLNFGHTVGHAVETCSGYSIPHGKAVAIGMAIITRAACRKGICPPETRDSLLSLIGQYSLPSETEYHVRELAGIIANDKKGSGNRLRLVVPEKIGSCAILDIAKDDIAAWLREGGVS